MNCPILMTGASGFIGRALSAKVQAMGYRVITLTRNAPKNDQIYWNPDRDEISLEALERIEGVIHLAGENIASFPWTSTKKERIFLSRVRTTWLLAHHLLRLKKRPRFFFSASAVGYYGSRGDEILTEASCQGTGFLAEVCAKWEEASKGLQQSGIRVIRGRFGNVVDPSGGFLKRMLPLFRWGLGAQLGDGKQWMSWISRDDLIQAILWIIFSSSLEGTINCCSPYPITQKEWVKAVANALHRPAFLKIPKPIVRLLFGEMGQALFLSSLRVMPERLLNSGYIFKDPQINPLLQKLF